MTTESTITFVVNAYWMIGITLTFLGGLFVVVWKGKGEINDAVEKGFQKHNDVMLSMKHNIDVIGKFLISKNNDFNRSELQTMSPFQLTEEGKRFIQSIGFDKVFEEHEQDFFKFIDSEDPKLKYDIETAAIKSIYLLSDEDFMNFLKIFFYNNPARNLENTAPTLGVFVRDEYLKDHPEIEK